VKQLLIRKLQKIGPVGIIIRVVLIWFAIAFLIVPNINMIISIFVKDGRFSTDVFNRLLSSERAIKALINSFILAFSLVISVNVVGVLLVLFTEYLEIKGAKILKLAYLSTLVYSGVVVATGYKFIYGSTGFATKLLLHIFPEMNPNWFTGYFAVMFVMTFACTSNHIIFLSNAIRGIDYQTVEAAKNMGASFQAILFKVVLPVLKPSMFALTILTFLTGLGAMSAPLIVGGQSFQTINPIIITFAKSNYSRDIAALLAVILGIATMGLLAIMNKVEKGGNYISISKVKSKITKQKINNPLINILAHATAYLLFVIYAGPILLVILFSFTNSEAIASGELSFRFLTVKNYLRLFTANDAYKPYLISLTYSILAAVAVALVAVVVSRVIQKYKTKFSATLEYTMLIPWLLPSTLIALGLMTTYNRPQMIMFNKVLIGSSYILLIAYIIVKIPFSLRMVKASFYSVENSLEEAATSMGSSPLNTMIKIVLPIIFPAVISVVALNFNSLIAEYDMTVFLYHPLLAPLGPVIKAASDEEASLDARTMVFVYSVILMLISSLALYFVYGKKKSLKKLLKIVGGTNK